MTKRSCQIHNLFTVLPLVLLAVIVMSFQGCESTSESLTMNGEVSGHISGLYNAPQAGIKVTAGDKTSYTSLNGYFQIPHVDYPYQLTVLDTINRKCIFIPKRENIAKYNLDIVNLTAQNSNLIPTEIDVTYPAGMFTSAGKVIFVDDNNKTFFAEAGATGGTINFGMAAGSGSYGSIYVLLYTKDNNGHIIHYDKYCVKSSVSIDPGMIYSLDFASSDFRPVSQQTTYHISLNPQQNHTVDLRYFYVNFGYRKTVNYLNSVIFETFGTDNFDIVVPGGSYFTAYPVAGFLSHDVSGNLALSNSYSIVEGSTTITAPQPPTLVSPSNNSSVDINTELVFNQGLNHVDNKFYKLYLIDTSAVNQQNSTYEVYLEKEKFALSDLSSLGLGSLKGRTFYWKVEIYYNDNINFYMSENRQNLTQLMSQSEQRILTVNP